ncbi:MAG: ATP-binding protein, partial [Fimbriimonadaceae bacterium]|nr:ATP-binding protein [Fimbriimonadaceae bacterium]
MPSLKQSCTPRPSVFDSNKRDTVHDILDLVKGNIDPNEFFTENYVTQGMRTFLTEAFKRLEGNSAGAQAIFRLSQSMGGGKTHNLIAFGLLCQNPELRDPVMGDFHKVGNLGKVRVVAFSGRQTDAQHGIWGEIAKQLGKQEQFSHFMTNLEAPGQEAWTQLLQGEPIAIILDELPPYMEYAHSRKVGDSNLAVVTTTALSNLFIAVADNKLSNVVLAVSDLSGAAYEHGHTRIEEIFEKVGSLKNLNQEAIRLSMPIDPVRMNSDELYQILRTRLFEKLPTESTVKEVANGYSDAIRKAKLQDITTASPEQFAADVESAYPFHPAIRDLYARFKENQGFQQTRALIRIMRIIVADLWNSGKAESLDLIGAHNINLADPEMVSEVKQINSKLDGAIAHDISSQGSASAEAIDAELGGTDAQDVSKLVFLASLADGPNQILGLNRGEIVQYLAAPGRDVAKLNKDAIDQ